MVELCRRYYEEDDENALPRAMASFNGFENAVMLDIAMGGSTNTVLHLLAAAHEAEVDFTMKDIDRLSRVVPVLSKVAPAVPDVHMEDVHRAGGIMALLGSLARAGLLHTDQPTVHSKSIGDAIAEYDVAGDVSDAVSEFYRAAPGGVPTQVAFSQNRRFEALDTDRENGVIRDAEHAFSQDGGLAVLYGNLAENGCIVKTAAVAEEAMTFTGTARVFESQDAAVDAIMANDKIKAGDVVIIRYEGPKGGPGMQEMLYPTSYLKSKRLDKVCALVTDGRFSGGTSGLSIGHVSPEAANGGLIGLVEDGDTIEISIPERSIHLAVSEAEIAERRTARDAKGWQPDAPRPRQVSKTLKAYAAFATSADRGAVRENQLKQFHQRDDGAALHDQQAGHPAHQAAFGLRQLHFEIIGARRLSAIEFGQFPGQLHFEFSQFPGQPAVELTDAVLQIGVNGCQLLPRRQIAFQQVQMLIGQSFGRLFRHAGFDHAFDKAVRIKSYRFAHRPAGSRFLLLPKG